MKPNKHFTIEQIELIDKDLTNKGFDKPTLTV